VPSPSSRPLKLVLLGATGAVGRAVVETLADHDVALASLRLLASARSAGERVEFRGDEHLVGEPKDEAFRGADVAIFATPADTSRAWAPRAAAQRCAVVDVSDAFRSDADVPLVVPEVNATALTGWRTRLLAAVPGAPATALALALAPLQGLGIERVAAVVLEPASGAGHRGVEQLEREAADLMNGREPDSPGPIVHRLAFNVVPQVGAFGPDAATAAESGLAAELRRILGAPELPVHVTALRVPLFYGTTVAVTIATRDLLAPADVRERLRRAPGVKVVDAPAEAVYPMPMLAVNDDAVLVGRIRRVGDRALDLVLVADNLRRGAAATAVELAVRIASEPPSAA
jgi:aspartate-semialdehyde dehydrogenase